VLEQTLASLAVLGVHGGGGLSSSGGSTRPRRLRRRRLPRGCGGVRARPPTRSGGATPTTRPAQRTTGGHRRFLRGCGNQVRPSSSLVSAP